MNSIAYWQTVGAAEVQCDDGVDRVNKLLNEITESEYERTYQTDASAAEAAKRQAE